MEMKKELNNKGFSLVELIIVIAIMAILVGVLAPQLMKYIEKTNVSADIQLADSVRTAVQTAIMDPEVMADANYQTGFISKFPAAGATLEDATFGCDIARDTIKDTLGVDSAANLTTLVSKIRSFEKAGSPHSIKVSISSTNRVKVILVNTDSSGKKQPASGTEIVVE